MEEKQNMSSLVGMLLIALLFFVWFNYFGPKPPEQVPEGPAQTAVPAAQTNTDGQQQPATIAPGQTQAQPDSVTKQGLAQKYGAFAASAMGTETETILENDLVKIALTNKGGRIKYVMPKNYLKVAIDSTEIELKSQLYLLEDSKNKFDLMLPVQGAGSDFVASSDLYFTSAVSGNTVTFRATAGEGKYLEQTYTLAPNNYDLQYDVKVQGLDGVLRNNQVKLHWENYLDKLEKNQDYERMYSSVYYKETNENTDYCNCQKDDLVSLTGKTVEWVSHSNQFFNTSILSNNFKFTDFVGETVAQDIKQPDLKLLKTDVTIPFGSLASDVRQMTIYTGPNEYKRLKAYNRDLESVVPYGSSIFGTINRWLMLPIFTFLSKFIGSKGLVILLLTIIVKALVYPLTYKMIHSQSKMSALKPHIEALRKKHGDDQQAVSMETMKLYGEYGVNPMGGCFPVLLQMPIWFALYRFFPASIEFRQASFLWATDLSSYDVAMHFQNSLPLLGNHLSLFTIIWVITTLWYTWYSMKQMDAATMNANPAMKYVQYIMPIVFLFFFNKFASGLTAYLAFSNLLNIGQTLVTKNFLIDQDKIKLQLDKNKAAPKKTTGFGAKFGEMMKEQQRLQEEKKKKSGK
jgi:YidC/Oxa1 family membrane protein insertase